MQCVLVVEDDPIIALDMSATIEDEFDVPVVVALNLNAAHAALGSDITFALLDVNVGPETSFALARRLASLGVPFAFTSGFNRVEIPDDLRNTIFLPKPCYTPDVVDTVRSALRS